MARMKRNIGDMVSGKIGNVVFVTIKDKSYVRAAPVRKKDSWSEQQRLYRQRLSKIAQLWRSIQSETIRPIWSKVSTEMNGYASFVKANMGALEIDGTLIDPRVLTVTDGKLAGLQLLKVQREAEMPDRIHVSWQNDKNSPKERGEDALMMMTYADDQFSPITPTGLKRGDQSGTFTLPGIEGRTLYLFMMSEEGMVSKSVGFGVD